MLRTIRKHTVNAKAQGLTEYIIIVALIAVASVAVVMVFGKQVRHAFLTITHSLAGTGTGEQVDQADTAGGIGQDRDIGLDDFDMSPKGGSGGQEE